MKPLFSLFVILSLILPIRGGLAMDAGTPGCGGCDCTAMSCCQGDQDRAGREAPANVPASETQVFIPNLALMPADLFLCALDETASVTAPADRLYQLPRQYVSSILRNCAFLI